MTHVLASRIAQAVRGGVLRDSPTPPPPPARS